MSPSEESTGLAGAVAELRSRIEQTIETGEVGIVARETVTNLVSGATKLYAALAEETETELPAIDATVSTTEAMVLACALLRAQHLTPFDLALWFQRTAPASRGDSSST